MLYLSLVAIISVVLIGLKIADEIIARKNRTWSDEPIEHIDLWEYPSNFYKGGKR